MAIQQRGSAAKVVIDTEATYDATPIAKSKPQVMYLTTESVRMSRNLVSSKTLRSTRQPLKPVRGNEEVAGDLNFELSPQCGRILHYALGSYNGGVGFGAGVYYHEFKIGSLPSFALEKGFTDLTTIGGVAAPRYFQYAGLKVNSLKVSGKTEGLIDSSVSVMGAREVIATVATLDSGAVDLGCAPFDGFGGSVFVNGVAVAEVTSIDFTLENGLDGNTYVMNGTGHRYTMPEGSAKVTGTMTCLFTDAAYAYYSSAAAHEEKALKLDFTAGTGAGTVGNEKMSFFFDEMLFRPQAPVIQGPTGLLVELPFEAYYENEADDSEDSALNIVLLCSVVSFNN